MNSFNDLMNDSITINENTLSSNGYGGKTKGESTSYDARVVEVYITVKNKAGELVYPDYKIFMTKNVPSSISNLATVTYDSETYEIKKKSAIKDENGNIISWVIFI